MEEILFALWVAAIIGPLAWSWYHKASIAMAMTLSLLFGYIVQLIWGWTLDSSQLTELYLRVVMIPALVESGHVHTLITSGFLHSWNSPLHVLGNIVIIALVGIPLEERLGRGKWLIWVVGREIGNFRPWGAV